jgi:3-phenylpropionate/trans-cinnamate dioxygenase ferredoxin reductase subunit
MHDAVVIAGAGQAGFQVAASLRLEGFDGSIILIGDEPGLPYQRPPLSKGYMAGKQAIEGIALRPAAFYEKQRIELLSGEKVIEIDRAGRWVTLASGRRIRYGILVLAVGARNRCLAVKGATPGIGAKVEGVRYLRTGTEAVEIKDRLAQAHNVVVIGGGFIGLELAAAASTLGKSVHVLEAQPRLMARAVSPILSDFYRDLHTGRGVNISLGVVPLEIAGREGKVSEVVLSDGSAYPADLVLIGVGVMPNVELASEAGLAAANGIVVDEQLRTEDENIYAIGDCADHPNPYAAARVRIESVQNAVDQAKCIAAAIVGHGQKYQAVPWFWTDQYDVNLQMVGLSAGYDHIVVRGEPESRKFSVFYFKQRRLVAIDSVNRPSDHIIGRKLIANGTPLTPEQAADPSVDLKALVH